MNRQGRGVRAWYKRAWRWLLGPVSDPHTHLGSSARIGGHIALATLCRYVLTNPHPDPYIVAALVSLVIACYGVRAKSTQRSELVMPAPRDYAARAAEASDDGPSMADASPNPDLP